MTPRLRVAESHLKVPRTARYWTAGDLTAASEVWFVLHGYRQLAGRFIRRFERLDGLDEGSRAVVAPEALSRFYIGPQVGPHGAESPVGASWMTRADREHEIADYVEYLDRLASSIVGVTGSGAGDPAPIGASGGAPGGAGGGAGGRPGARIVVLGFSQGAETASRWVAHGRVAPAELVLWGGGLAVDLDPARLARALAHVRVRLVVGDEDAWADERAGWSTGVLEGAGVSVERIDYVGGHRVEPHVLAANWPRNG